jgi:predicted dehydrogenase
MWDLDQGGGALLDLGVYPVSWVQMVLAGADNAAGPQARRFTGVQTSGARGPNGADAESALLLTTHDGRYGVAECSLRSRLPGGTEIRGGQGRIEVPPRFHHPQRIVVHPRDGDGESEPVVETHPCLGGGYAHELIEVQECLAAGRTESAVMPLDDTLAVMEALETALHDLGIHFTEAEGITA